MSNIDKTNSMEQLMSVLGTAKNHKVDRVNKPSTETPNSISLNRTPQQLKKEISNAISQFDLSIKEEQDKARKIMVSKMIYWRFSELEHSNIELSNLTKTVNQQISQSSEARELLHGLLSELHQ